jgi:hypothetical protein
MSEAPRHDYAFHPLADKFPLMEGDDLAQLAWDIRHNGLLEKITLFEGKILDGRNRYRAAKSIVYEFTSLDFTSLRDGVKAEAFVISANIHRRHLTAKQKRDLLADLIKADPTKSDRQIGADAKVDHKTVGDVRAGLETTGEIPQSEIRVGADGKTRKTKTGAKKSAAKVKGGDWNAYHAIQEKLIDALTEWPSSSDHALEWANKTRDRLDEVIDAWCQRENEAEAEAA